MLCVNCVHVYVHVMSCAYACQRVCVCVRACVCQWVCCVCMQMCVCVCVHAHVQMCVCVCEIMLFYKGSSSVLIQEIQFTYTIYHMQMGVKTCVLVIKSSLLVKCREQGLII